MEGKKREMAQSGSYRGSRNEGTRVSCLGLTTWESSSVLVRISMRRGRCWLPYAGGGLQMLLCIVLRRFETTSCSRSWLAGGQQSKGGSNTDDGGNLRPGCLWLLVEKQKRGSSDQISNGNKDSEATTAWIRLGLLVTWDEGGRL